MRRRLASVDNLRRRRALVLPMHAMAMRARRASAALAGLGALEIDALAELEVMELSLASDDEEQATPLPFRESLR